MNAPQKTAEAPGREPEFVRLWLPQLELWVAAYRLSGGNLSVELCEERTEAKVFVSPPAGDVEEISRRFITCLEVPATFAEWVAGDPRRDAQKIT